MSHGFEKRDMTSIAEKDFESHFQNFEKKFPTVEVRHAAAKQLASPDLEMTPPEATFIGRNFVVAHWGDSESQRRSAYQYLHDLKAKIEEHKGGPLIVLRGGLLDEILSDRNDYLTSGVVLDYGVITETDIIHKFVGKLLNSHSPHLSFHTHVSVSTHTQIEGDDTDVYVSPQQPPTTTIPVYNGTVPLEFNQDTYRIGRTIEQPRLIFGAESCTMVLEELASKSHSPRINSGPGLAGHGTVRIKRPRRNSGVFLVLTLSSFDRREACSLRGHHHGYRRRMNEAHAFLADELR